MFLAAAATHWLWSVAGPDARIVGQSLRENQNYPTDLPLSFLLVALTLVLLGRWSAYIIEVQQARFCGDPAPGSRRSAAPPSACCLSPAVRPVVES